MLKLLLFCGLRRRDNWCLRQHYRDADGSLSSLNYPTTMPPSPPPRSSPRVRSRSRLPAAAARTLRPATELEKWNVDYTNASHYGPRMRERGGERRRFLLGVAPLPSRIEPTSSAAEKYTDVMLATSEAQLALRAVPAYGCDHATGSTDAELARRGARRVQPTPPRAARCPARGAARSGPACPAREQLLPC